MLINKNFIKIISDNCSKIEIFEKVSEILYSNGFIKNKENVITQLQNRELLGSTGFENGIAIPHCKLSEISEPLLLFFKVPNIDWESMDGQKTNNIFVILAPDNKNGKNEHLEILANISVLLMDKTVISELNSLITVEEIVEFINTSILKKEIELISNESLQSNIERKPKKFIVAITGCNYGLSHTYMAEKRLIDFCKENNITIKVETRGSKGNLNKITDEEFKKADSVILALDKEFDLPEIENKHIIKVRTIDVIKNTNKVINDSFNSKLTLKNKVTILVKSDSQKALMKVASYTINYFQWIALFIGFVVILHSFNVINDGIYTKISQIIMYGSLAIPSIAGYALIKYFTKRNFEANVVAFILLGFNFYLNILNSDTIKSVGLITSIIIAIYAIIFQKLIFEKLRNHLKQKKLRGSIEWFLQLIFVISVFIVLWYIHIDLSYGNFKMYEWINLMNNEWWFRIITAFIFFFAMLYDMGGPINKWSIILSSIIFCDSSILGLDKIWAIPLTAQVLGITMPGISIWFRSIMFKKYLNQEELKLSKKSGIGAYNGISEESLWIYEKYKHRAILANLSISIIIASLIGILNVRYYGGYNFILGSIIGISFDNVLNNQFINVFNENGISFNLGFLIITSFGVLIISLIYELFFRGKYK